MKKIYPFLIVAAFGLMIFNIARIDYTALPSQENLMVYIALASNALILASLSISYYRYRKYNRL
ncbi:hypothetical protein H9Q13_11440 [Pontibacter sp. JH31]|uniref:Uncharacterized protein n=1 Tax=Pontibacter aquaedesilientis TaxID=2766980 RepID=A0ABR7XHR5_9BACT|nr:hypothetical protein [Pontibacter aquaedesilientis]MBD1397779.1 hypothetical protein [Pontibacter aquaedesilientis]